MSATGDRSVGQSDGVVFEQSPEFGRLPKGSAAELRLRAIWEGERGWRGVFYDRRSQDRQKDVFVATLAHELRNPLAPIRAGAHAMKHYQAALPAQIQGSDADISRSTEAAFTKHLAKPVDPDQLIQTLRNIGRFR
ncbi:histidine kinase dimerization/phospho-acceptor domain-containing protein [Paraburkholderia fynbosensis]|uniref:histidine kinase n=1 Tax=Paraburkholderia fynbosensis TaxID=1200993 RepID=A0A6J5GTK7_9BURK|nr:hypothetical protein LMG27177_06175 [Paraburkholderia fynbosensis]